jgi:hypothetical protein
MALVDRRAVFHVGVSPDPGAVLELLVDYFVNCRLDQNAGKAGHY